MVLSRTRLVNVLVALAMIFAAMVGGALVAQVDVAGAGPSSGIRPVTEPITPCRILETRGAGSGGPTGVPLAGQIQAGQTLTLQVSGAAGQGGCTVGTGLSGAVLNVTAVNATLDTFVTVFPCDAPRPNASTLNPFPNRITFNSAVSDLSATGTVCIFNNAGAVDIIVDATGILYDHNHDDRYFTETEVSAGFVGAPSGVRVFAAAHVNGGSNTIDSVVGPIASVANPGAGQYTVTTSTPFRTATSSNIYISVTSVNIFGNTCVWSFAGASTTTFNVDCYTAAGVAADTSFSVIMYIPGAGPGLLAAESTEAPDPADGR